MTGTAHKLTIDVLAPAFAQGLGESPRGLWLTNIVATTMAYGYLHVGNFGNIVEPANAKNVLSVGATQSDGRDLYTGMKGKDYLVSSDEKYNLDVMYAQIK